MGCFQKKKVFACFEILQIANSNLVLLKFHVVDQQNVDNSEVGNVILGFYYFFSISKYQPKMCMLIKRPRVTGGAAQILNSTNFLYEGAERRKLLLKETKKFCLHISTDVLNPVWINRLEFQFLFKLVGIYPKRLAAVIKVKVSGQYITS